MLSEKLFLEALQKSKEVKRICGCDIYFGVAPESTNENVLVLSIITQSSLLDAAAATPLFQLDVYNKESFRAIEIADELLTYFYKEQITMGSYYLGVQKVERLNIQKCEDGTYRVPLEIKLLVKEII